MERMERRRCFALLAAVGGYTDMDEGILPVYGMDLQIMQRALVEGLRVPVNNIRIMGQKGWLAIREFARALQEFTSLLTGDGLSGQ